MPRLYQILCLIGATSSVILTSCSANQNAGQEMLRPTIEVTAGSGSYFMPFDINGDWFSGAGAASEGVTLNGEYHLTITQAGAIAWTHNRTSFAEGSYSVNVRLVNGPEASAFGFFVMADPAMDHFLYFIITADGRYDIGECQTECKTMESFLDGWVLEDSLKKGDAVNKLGMEIKSDSIIFSINEVPVQELSAYPISSGIVGLIGESGPYYGFEAAFDNFQIIPPVLPTVSPPAD